MKDLLLSAFSLILLIALLACESPVTQGAQVDSAQEVVVEEGTTQDGATEEEIPHYLRKENFIVLRVLIFNDDNQVLMVGGEGWWGMPWVNLTKRQFVNEAIDSMAMAHGIEIADLELKGQFCFKYDYKPTVTFRNYYTAKYKSGELKLPPNTLEDEFTMIEWVNIPEAIRRNGNTGIRAITEHITSHPNAVWGGSFMVSHTEDDHPTKMVEDFYLLYKR